jgi:hypothetical protein
MLFSTRLLFLGKSICDDQFLSVFHPCFIRGHLTYGLSVNFNFGIAVDENS